MTCVPHSAAPRREPLRQALTTGDLFALTAALVGVPSESFNEQRITDLIEAELRRAEHLEVERIGDNLVARTRLGSGSGRRILLAGHTDTVPANNNAEPRIDGDVLWGLGSVDMKGGVAVLLDLALSVSAPAVDVTFVFYAREEVGAADNGLLEVAAAREDLLQADVALLGEPTNGVVEAGCQGTMRFEVTLRGKRAHSARGWMGRNAIHRLAGVLAVAADYRPRLPVIEGCEYREGLEAVAVSGGVAGNVVPDEAKLLLNHRFAPDRSVAQASEHIRELLAPVLDDGDNVEVVDSAPGALPGLQDPLLVELVRMSGAPARAKLGWTDAAFFSARGVPASNFGPGDPLLAHAAAERVERSDLTTVHRALKTLLTTPV
ncbi:MAG: succinyl-diaminopimelate desuccinylase [Acidimicrobiaceae bacterium]|nr:succinyl-diaminopimelate desuccinylase [Acidimicrobiaceae bacterium]MCY4176585.1 succinyl-diaminopimelate desuccinylase [Acidimicrobiaceae bacterium]MCY4294891.1 succinyl-diaminopimelate desuccinylase [Acidimicrobiaceae bacterium]